MVFASDRSLFELFDRTLDDAVVYGDAEMETVLHEGPVRVLPNGWVEVPSGRLISPSAVHHIDTQPER
ncbi:MULTISPECIES: hypothetical protein [Haloferax]|uniref:Uncharacterized protein n=1 Tax=Haloferax marinum TaxID=2666143 RepID=A0A6A8G6C9_9EURY|nr:MULTISPECIES: hypothetical protein [Haloferax]KAB1197588.1 hypothetical protein Hfx1150_08680 [Haloferax sp. CBA1150]MRW96639.1 hypothetical protein [Haloferax marinum]